MVNADGGAGETLQIEVAYALPESSSLIALEVAAGTSIEQAIHLSGIMQRHPEIDLSVNRVGLFGRRAALDTLLVAGDRVEIYRPLSIDPKTARRLRAAQAVK